MRRFDWLNPRASLLLGAWLSLSIIFTGAGYWWAHSTAADSLATTLEKQLPEQLDQALSYGFREVELIDRVTEKINRDLAALSGESLLPVVYQCRATVARLMSDNPHTQVDATDTGFGAAEFSVDWRIGTREQHSEFTLDCNTRWAYLLTSQLSLALLATVLLGLLPLPLSSACRKEVHQLRDAGMSNAETIQVAQRLSELSPGIRTLFERLRPDFIGELQTLLDWLQQPGLAALTSDQLAWLEKAYAHSGGDLTVAADVASSQPQLEFFIADGRLRVHGLDIALPKTPFFYYLWYARLRHEGEGWVLNPAVNRPDREGGEDLVALMEVGNGHAKAINDLRENGLRAKTLDQNRNKIKDELIATLGDSLAGPYLFDVERDPKSGRNRYRLVLDRVAIRIH
ncbi:hypothetical protein [Microbulbifer aggregans]|uniref:hypothetical protein n=1 Tax=Microbulbifer aggregans TaxID=1769779 RepID=UPI001CFE8331|nr:hypothetical protein [Microbulbifer aggregans]